MSKARRMTTTPGDEHFAKYAIGAYGRDSWVCALEYCPQMRTFIDVGAHIGHFTYNAMGRFKRIVAIEPMGPNFACLRENVDRRMKRLVKKPHVRLAQAVAGREPQTSVPVSFRDPSGGENSGAWEAVLGKADGLPYIHMDVITIDSLALSNVDLIKIDVQGWEADVIDGAVNTIKHCRPVIIIEVAMNDNLNQALIDKVQSHGYWHKAIVQKNGIFVPRINA